MKKWLLLAFCFAFAGLSADYFQSTTEVSPLMDNDYLLELTIEKIVDDIPQLIASPMLVCIEGEPAEVEIESDEENLFIRASLFESIGGINLLVSMFIKEQEEITWASNQIIRLGTSYESYDEDEL